MKDARDIRLLGLGFVAGMVLCYFLTLDGPVPPGSATVMLAQATPVAPATAPLTRLPFGLDADQSKSPRLWPDQPTLKKYGHPLLDIKEAPDFKREQGLPIDPALKMKSFSPDGVSLIDFNYKPDFKIPGNWPKPQPGKGVEIDLNLLKWDQGFTPNLNEQRLRIEPARKIIAPSSPGGVIQYDLIDLNYQPDFKLPD